MTGTVKALVCASVCFTLMLPLSSFAQKGSGGGGTGGGGGGTATPPPAPQNPPLQFTGGSTSLTVGSDQPAHVQLTALSDGRDAPVITKVAGPDGLILFNTAPVDHPHGTNGYTTAEYAWTPSRADIGTAPVAVFTATTLSGARATVTVTLGPVVDVPPGAISGLTATLVGDRIQANWSSNATGTSATFSMSGCYHTLLPGTNLPYLFCDHLDSTTALQSNVPASPTVNVGQPGVPVNYYGIFVGASGTVAQGTATANVQ
ncbi:MAG: hypothetical protein JWQ49_5897 [Edaphobacter sp.]|nr:hypothetical protein [Edaphobacter sp.]